MSKYGWVSWIRTCHWAIMSWSCAQMYKHLFWEGQSQMITGGTFDAYWYHLIRPQHLGVHRAVYFYTHTQEISITGHSLCFKLIGSDYVSSRNYFVPVDGQQVLGNILEMKQKIISSLETLTTSEVFHKDTDVLLNKGFYIFD